MQLEDELTNKPVEAFVPVKEESGVVNLASTSDFDMELDIPIDILNAASGPSADTNTRGPF